MVKRNIYGPRPLIWAYSQVYNQVSMTFRSKVQARTSSSLEKLLFLAILANLTTSGRVFLTEMVKRHIYGPRPLIWAYNQVSMSMTFRLKVLARTGKWWPTDSRTDEQTDGHPNSIGPQLWGWGLKLNKLWLVNLEADLSVADIRKGLFRANLHVEYEHVLYW